MTDQKLYASINGIACHTVRLLVGYAGPWSAEVHLTDDTALPATARGITLQLGSLTLIGTVVADTTGTQALQRKVRVVGGSGGWGQTVESRGYHNDAGVKARLVVEDLCRDIGEQLGAQFVPRSERVGVDYARSADIATRSLAHVIGGDAVAWWVDYAGNTQVGARPVSSPDPTLYTVLAYDASERMVTLSADDLSQVVIGATLTAGLDQPGTIRELEMMVEGGKALTIYAWVGGEAQQPGKLALLLRQIAQRATDGPVYGIYRYRVVTQAGDGRCDLQAVRVPGAAAPTLPDLKTITPWPGQPGQSATLTPGSEVLVQFVSGDRAQPIICGFAPQGSDGFAPIVLNLGGPGGQGAARIGDPVEVLLPPMTFVGTIGGASSVGTVSATLPKAIGQITAGSVKVNIA